MCITLAGPVVVDTTLGLSLEPDHLPPAQVQAPISHLKASYLCLILLLSPLWTLRIVGRQCYKMQIKSRWNHFLSKPSKDLYPYRNPLRPSSQLLFLCPVPIPTLPGPSLSHQDLGCLPYTRSLLSPFALCRGASFSQGLSWASYLTSAPTGHPCPSSLLGVSCHLHGYLLAREK